MKTSRCIAAALVLALAPCGATSVALAQPASDDPITTMARARFKEGVDFYDKGSFDQARASFLQAYALKKHPAVLLNLAWSCLKSGHTLEAKRYFEQFLAESKDASDKQKADANDGLSQARAKLGRIEIQAAAGTEVTIDGDRAGTAPLPDAVAVEAGAHTVKFRGPDGTQDTESVSVLAGQKAVARFGSGGPAPVPPAVAPAPAPSPTPPPPEATAPTPPAPDTAAPSSPPPATSSGGTSVFTPPSNLAPVFIFTGIAVAGAVTAIVMGNSKSNAQTNANNIAAQIVANGGGTGTCAPGTLAADPTHTFANACSAYSSDVNDVNQDATIANVAIGVGIAGLVGAIVYWAVADKGGGSGSAALPVISPVVGKSSGSMTLGWQF